MKNLFKNLMLVAVAAMGFTACEQVGVESVAPVAPEVKMTVIAGMDDTRTYIDEANSIVKWSDGDQLKVIENSATYRNTTATTIGEDGKAMFTVSFPENTTDAEFTYNAVFPASAVVEDDAEKVSSAKVKVIVKEQQNATATSFDPTADVLVAKQLEFSAQPTELNMQFKRLVSLGKLTLNNLPADAKIEKVIFTAAEGVKLVGRNYVDATTGEVSQYGYYDAKNALTINYNEAISTRDIYFTCNPFEMVAGETFTVKAVCGDKSYTREVTIPDGRSLKFTEGNLGTFSVDMTNATVETISAFAEGQYAVIAKSGSKYYAMAGVKGSGNFMTYAEVEYDGTATTFATEDDTLVWNIKAVEGGYTIQNHEDKYLYGSSSGNYAYLGNAQTLTLTLVDGTTMQYKVGVKDIAERILAFNATSGQERFAFYKGTQVNNLFLVPVAEDTTPRFTVDINEYTFEAEGGKIEVTIEKLNGFSAEVMAVTGADWLEVSGGDDGETFTIEADENEDAAREADVTFTSGELRVTVKISQKAGVVVDPNITVAQFLELKDTNTEYQLTGKITRVVNTTYGNFDLTDATGTVLVYGLLTPDGKTQQQWAAAGLKVGDIITVKGKYKNYNGTDEMENATYVSHKAVAVDKTALEFAAEGSSQEITVTLVNTTDAINVTVDNNHFTVALKSGTTYTVTAPANETEEAIQGNLTFTAGELTATVALTQAAPTVEGVVPGGRDDFNTVTANSSYTSRKSTAGWVGSNCAVFEGGKLDSNNTIFTFIGTNNSTRAFTINGKTSAKGKITSPTLTTGCGKLSLKYGNAFSESNGVDFTVTIKQNGAAVQTYKIDVDSITQKTAYTWEQEVNVAGDFVIEITNNCPSNNSSKNKDRVSIWDIVWTGYNN